MNDATKTAGLSANRTVRSDSFTSEVPLQVHARVEAGHLLAVAVEHQRLAPEELADAALGRLAPARVVHRRVDIRIEAVLVGRLVLPGAHRLLLDEADLRDRLDVLESVLPRDDQPYRRAVLVRDDLAVEPDRHDRERVHRFVQAKPL